MAFLAKIREKVTIVITLSLVVLSPAQGVEDNFQNRSKVFMVPTRNHFFVGRSEELSKIKTMLNHNNGTLSVVGLPGIGKTHLSKEYAYRSKEIYDLIWWFDMSSPLEPQFVKLAHAWNQIVQNDSEKFSQASIEGAALIQIAKKILLKSTKRWLFIFDNVQRLEELPSFCFSQKIDPTNKHHVILTSKNNLEWEQSLILKPLSRKESVELLKMTLYNGDNDQRHLEELANLFNDIPVALMQAVSYIQRVPSLTVPKYIDLFKNHQEVLERLESQLLPKHNSNYDKAFRSAIDISLEELRQSSLISYEALLFIAFIHPQNISEKLLGDWLENQGHQKTLVHEVIYNLSNRFFLEKTYEYEGSFYEIHQLLQSTVRSLVSENSRRKIRQDIKKLFLSFLEIDSWQVSETLEKFPELYNHMKAAYMHLDKFQSSHLLFMIHLFHAALFYQNDQNFAHDLLASIESFFKKESSLKLDPFTHARYLNTKGKCLFTKSLEQTIQETKEAISILKKIHNDPRVNSEFFLASINNLVDYLQIQGRIKEAQNICEEFQPILAKLDHKIYDTLYYSFLSLCYMYDGLYEKALEAINRSYLSLKEGKLSEYLFIFVLVNKAEILTRIGNLQEAERLVQKLKKDLLDIFQTPLNHLVIRTKIIDSYIKYQKGEKEKSKELIQTAISEYDKLVHSPSKDPLQAFGHTLLGKLYTDFKDYKKAVEEYEIAEKIYDSILKVKEIDDLSDLYVSRILTAVKIGNTEQVQNFFHKQIRNFGFNHERTQATVSYFDEKGLPVPW